MIRERHEGELIYFTADPFSEQKNLAHLFTSRAGGVSTGHLCSLNLGFSLGDSRENVLANYERVCKILKMPLRSIVPAKQVHEDTVRIVTKEDAGHFPPKGDRPGCDSLITGEAGITLAAFYADCTVALFFDPEKRVIGAAHAGWRGTALAIYRKTVLQMQEHFGCRPENILVAFSPSIGPCCFETDEDVPEALLRALPSKFERLMERKGTKWHIDLAGINRGILENSGVLAEHITDAGYCTGCEAERFWSHRKTRGKRGVSGAFIAIR